jgi:iron(III) transport system substrate-binding protein
MIQEELEMKSCVLTIFIGLIFITAYGCGQKKADEVVVYVSVDQVFSEPILKDFEKETGIHVKAVYDTEEAKGTGVMNRLIAEKSNPQADVYWANEPIRAEVLKQQGIAAPYVSPNASDISEAFKDPDGYWTGFSARARVLIVNKEVKDKPVSIRAYADPNWKGKAVIANPLFGTTAVQISVLFTLWGDEQARTFMNDIKKNAIKLSTSNGESADMVASGEFGFSLVDSDDAVNRMRQGKPVVMIFPDQREDESGCLILPNAVLLIQGAHHPENAKKLIDYLLSEETERKLAFADCAQIPLHVSVETPDDLPKIDQIKSMKVNYKDVAEKLQEIQVFLKEWAGF